MTAPAPITILIVDDDPWVTRGLAAILAVTPGMRVLGVAHSGEEAVASFRAERADIVLMDLNMGPGLTGVDATTAIIKEFPDARVLVLTTTAPGPGLVRALHVGALAALNKTASQATLVDTIRAAVLDDDPVLLRGLASDIMAGDVDAVGIREDPPKLTPAELRALRLICEGKRYSEIAAELHVTPATVETHAKRLRQKLKAGSLAQLIVRAIEYRFVNL